MKKWKILAVTIVLAVGLAGCGKGNITDLTEKISEDISEAPEQKEEPTEEEEQQFAAAYYHFAAELLKESGRGEKNALVSPLSVLTALTMTENGAAGETLTQMEEVLAGGMDVELQNRTLTAYLNRLPEGKKGRLHQANSIWFNTANENMTVSEDFLKKNKTAYGAEIFEADFDESTKKSINQWVEKATKGMIPEIIDKIPEDASMYLVNALAFEGEWDETYEGYQVRPSQFTNEAGIKEVPMMYSKEHCFLEDETTIGFRKPYAKGYDFVALLPRKEGAMEEYLQDLSGEKLQSLLEKENREVQVNAGIPKFENQFDIELSEVLKTMGMELPFHERLADFSGMGTAKKGANTYISRVLHKTYISVFEEGTRAGAATAVEMVTESAEETMGRVETVILNRPFVYAIVDKEEKLPIFLGVQEEIE